MAEAQRVRDEVGRKADESDGLDAAVRVGLVAYAVVHLLVAWLALQLALGDRSGAVSGEGALSRLAREPWGQAGVWAVAVGLALLVLWRLLDAVVSHRHCEGSDLWKNRAKDLVKATVYGVLAWSATKVALGGGSDGGGTDTLTARVMQLPAGQLLVGAVGVAVVGYGVALAWKGLSEKHAEHLAAEGRAGDAGRAYLLLGKVGYVAKGAAVAAVGWLFLYAAWTHDARESGGLDQALHEVLRQPAGPFLVGAVAVGIACYGLFCLARARHLSR